MSLKEKLLQDMQDAMRSGDELRKSTIRMARAAIKNAEMARSDEMLSMAALDDITLRGALYQEIRQRRAAATQHEQNDRTDLADKERAEIARLITEASDLGDAGVEDVLRKEIKQRRDSAEQYRRGNRPDLVERELAEVEILQAYLPQQMGESDIEAEVRAVISEVGATGPKDISKVMPVVMSRLRGRAEGRIINQVVTRLLAEGTA